MKILAFGASTSSTSINRTFANYVAAQVPDADVTELDLQTFDLPIYDADEEAANGVPPDAQRFRDLISEHDGIVISLAEHNGSYTAAFKNIFDWASRLEGKVWAEKPMLLLATSPGGRGGLTVLEAAASRFPRMGGEVRATFSLPSFHEHFADGAITDAELADGLSKAIAAFTDSP